VHLRKKEEKKHMNPALRGLKGRPVAARGGKGACSREGREVKGKKQQRSRLLSKMLDPPPSQITRKGGN